ncbi:hypothetical protein CKO51_14850 [Rhodopirellula sp. SM50]|nr:hypothetical protein CKO51_14850 [Rhodopirellula sp. SM50]
MFDSREEFSDLIPGTGEGRSRGSPDCNSPPTNSLGIDRLDQVERGPESDASTVANDDPAAD